MRQTKSLLYFVFQYKNNYQQSYPAKARTETKKEACFLNTPLHSFSGYKPYFFYKAGCGAAGLLSASEIPVLVSISHCGIR